MMEMGLIFLNSAQNVNSQVRTAEEIMGQSSVVLVEPRRGVRSANPFHSYLREGSPRGVNSPEAMISRRTRKVTW